MYGLTTSLYILAIIQNRSVPKYSIENARDTNFAMWRVVGFLVSVALLIFYSNRQTEMGIEIIFIKLKGNFLEGTCYINDLII